jgi:hypothetical protein
MSLVSVSEEMRKVIELMSMAGTIVGEKQHIEHDTGLTAISSFTDSQAMAELG